MNSRGRPFLALQDAGLGVEILPSRATGEVERWFFSGGAVLWVRGAPGSGRTAAVGSAMRKALLEHPDVLTGAFRVAGVPGSRFEEALFHVNGFLRQLGIEELDGVLDQRTSLTSKIAILIEVLRRKPVLLWLDDFENLSASGGSDPGHPIHFLARELRDLKETSGRLILVTERDGPDGLKSEEAGIPILDMAPGIGIAPSLQVKRLLEISPFEADPEDLKALESPGTPLQVRLRFALLAASNPGDRSGLLERVGGVDPRKLVLAIRDLLDPSARTILDIAAAFREPLSRGALRAAAEAPAGWQEEATEEAAASLVRLGLAGPSGEEGSSIRLHPSVAREVESHLMEKDLEGWKAIQKRIALHLADVGNRTGSSWHLIRSRERLFSCGSYREAYEIQKSFLEELLRRGLNELARSILEESARTMTGIARAVSLGNLAIIQKSEGNLDEAARIYEEVLGEFESLGDLPNLTRVHHQLGNLHYLRGDLDRAISSYRQSMEISEEIGERAVCAATQIQIANVQYLRGHFEEALESYRSTLKLAREIEDKTLTTAIHLQIGQLLFSLRRLTEAEEELQAAERDLKATGDRRNLIKASQLLGLVAGERRDYDQALAHLEEAAETAISLGDPLEIASAFLRIGHIEAERLQFAKAVGTILRALDLVDVARERAQMPLPAGDLKAYRGYILEQLQAIAAQMGPEAFARILRGLGREDPLPPAHPPPPAP